MKYSNLATDSIRLMAESVCDAEISQDVATILSEDASQRVRLIIAKALKFMRHSNRNKLTCADINKALKWSDCQPVFGHESNSEQRLRYSYLAEARVFKYENNIIDLEQFKDKPRTDTLLKDLGIAPDEATPRLSISDLTVQ